MAELHMPHAEHAGDDNPTVHHEESDVNIRAIFGFGAGMVAVGIVLALAVFVLFRYFAAQEKLQTTTEYPLAAGQDLQPPEPRLQTNPREDLRELRVKEEALLGSYGWVDKNAGIVRIPIDRAMTLTLQRGLPARRSSDQR
jgi:hypothetical protein